MILAKHAMTPSIHTRKSNIKKRANSQPPLRRYRFLDRHGYISASSHQQKHSRPHNQKTLSQQNYCCRVAFENLYLHRHIFPFLYLMKRSVRYIYLKQNTPFSMFLPRNQVYGSQANSSSSFNIGHHVIYFIDLHALHSFSLHNSQPSLIPRSRFLPSHSIRKPNAFSVALPIVARYLVALYLPRDSRRCPDPPN